MSHMRTTSPSMCYITGRAFSSFFFFFRISYLVIVHKHFLSVCSFHLHLSLKVCLEVLLKLAFLRLVGMVYFLKNLPDFRNQFQSPIAYHCSYSTECEVPTQKHFTRIKNLKYKDMGKSRFWGQSYSLSWGSLTIHLIRSRRVLLTGHGDKLNVDQLHIRMKTNQRSIACRAYRVYWK